MVPSGTTLYHKDEFAPKMANNIVLWTTESSHSLLFGGWRFELFSFSGTYVTNVTFEKSQYAKNL